MTHTTLGDVCLAESQHRAAMFHAARVDRPYSLLSDRPESGQQIERIGSDFVRVLGVGLFLIGFIAWIVGIIN